MLIDRCQFKGMHKMLLQLEGFVLFELFLDLCQGVFTSPIAVPGIAGMSASTAPFQKCILQSVAPAPN